MCQESAAWPGSSRPWTVPALIGYSVLIGAAFLGVQLLVAVVMGVFKSLADPTFDAEAWSMELDVDGTYLFVATVASTVVSIALIRFLVGRREAAPRAFLRLSRTEPAAFGRWALALIAFVVVADLITIALGRSVVTEWMVAVYESAHPALLIATMVLAAPLLEEIVFRGFLAGVLEALGASAAAVIIVSSASWAAIHLQYDGYGIATIFMMGLVLGLARRRTGSILPCIVMHAMANAIALAETAFIASSA